MHLHVVPVFEGSTQADQVRLADKRARLFKITARLTINPEIDSNIRFDFPEDAGDSLFALGETATSLKVDVPRCSFQLFQNSNRRLATARFDCTAHSADEARQQFFSTVQPILDHLTYIGKTPLHVSQISLRDEIHKIVSTDILCPYPTVTINPGLLAMRSRLGPVYAMYREATNATSPFYKFLCLYKILEGLLLSLRAKLHEEAKERGISLPPLQRKVPAFPSMSSELAAYTGKSIKRFFDEFLTNHFRNAMAHFMTDDGSALNVSSLAEMEKYSSVIHLTDLCCREAISHIEACVDVLESNPTGAPLA
jgi:hypothetical protein